MFINIAQNNTHKTLKYMLNVIVYQKALKFYQDYAKKSNKYQYI